MDPTTGQAFSSSDHLRGREVDGEPDEKQPERPADRPAADEVCSPAADEGSRNGAGSERSCDGPVDMAQSSVGDKCRKRQNGDDHKAGGR